MVKGSVLPFILLISQFFLVIGMFSLLLFVEPLATLIAAGIFSFTYALVYVAFMRRIEIVGEKRLDLNRLRFKKLGEYHGLRREMKIYSLEKIFTKEYKRFAKQYRDCNTTYSSIQQLPKFFIEIVVFGALILLLMSTLIFLNSFEELVPTLAIFAIAGYRLLPAIQGIYSNFTSIKFQNIAVQSLLNLVQKKAEENQIELTGIPEGKIEFKNVGYKFQNAQNSLFKDLNISFEAKKFNLLIGNSGSGKSTILDILSQLINVTEGKLIAHGKPLSDSESHHIRFSVGYVSQHIFFQEGTIAENVALGRDKIDRKLVVDCLVKAGLKDFATETGPTNLNTQVGENAIWLSGGQRQRPGIARALYQKPGLLLLDEATVGLDIAMLHEILEQIKELSKSITVICVSHQQEAIPYADNIINLNDELSD